MNRAARLAWPFSEEPQHAQISNREQVVASFPSPAGRGREPAEREGEGEWVCCLPASARVARRKSNLDPGNQSALTLSPSRRERGRSPAVPATGALRAADEGASRLVSLRFA